MRAGRLGGFDRNKQDAQPHAKADGSPGHVVYFLFGYSAFLTGKKFFKALFKRRKFFSFLAVFSHTFPSFLVYPRIV
ncbi:MAG: hypothetical protein A2021_07045 [Elusimicrobia bacterium GWF2_52_66]|nr:MAG: hypothetical protein A2X33_03730 [Elusimicrobia bacterium GWA2_51_34]OGR88078.1 MAG: hypothetical protein A2021_07045 [Elusimicrobia bacterium GWF2_52_66]